MTSRIPTLAESYSGIPERLLEKATALKEESFALQTLEISPRKTGVELPIIPKGYSRSKFNQAIKSLCTSIGRDNVKLNTDSLDDGW